MSPELARWFPSGACGVAFKEWLGICRALASGRQSLLLRKGGISEGPGGFRPEHPAFWLFPTRLHEAAQGIRPAPDEPAADPAPGAAPSPELVLSTLAVVESATWVDDPDALAALEPLHAWTAETVASRFAYRAPGLWVLGVRAYHDPEGGHAIVPTAAQAGCRSWVTLDPPLAVAGLAPVLGEAEARSRRAALAEALGDPRRGGLT